MAVQNGALLAFNRGTVSRLALARTDLKRMALSAEIQTNYMPRVLGSMMLRPGMQFIGLTAASQYLKMIPFIKRTDDTALCEMTQSKMRVWVNDALVTRISVATVIVNGTFAGNIASWTDNSEAGASIAYVASMIDMEGDNVASMGLTGTGQARAIARQTVSVGGADLNKEHAVAINIARGPVTLKIGTVAGDDSYIAETTLFAGRHSLAFVPGGNFVIEFSNALKRRVDVSSVAIEAAGVMSIFSPFSGAQSQLRTDESADVIFVASGDDQMRIERRGIHSWSLVYDQPEDGPFRAENFMATTIAASAQTGEITLTASEPLFKAGHVNALFRIASIGQNVSGIVAGNDQWTDPVKVTGIGGQRRIAITITGTWVGKVSLYASVGGIGNWTLASVASGGWVFQWTADTAASPFVDGYDNQIIYYRLGFASGDYTSGSATASIAYSSGSINGIARITAVASSTSASAYTLRDLGSTLASSNWWEGIWSSYRGFPTSVQIHEGRLWWFGSDWIIGSVSDAFDSLDDTIEGDSGPIIRTIGKGPVDIINGALSLQRLLIFPQGAEKSIRSSSLDEVLTPANFNIKDCSTQGSAAVAPVRVDQAGFYIQRSGRRIFRIDFQGYYSAVDYASTDMTSINPDIGIDGGGFTLLAVQRQPDTRIHGLLADGTAAVLVYDNAENEQALVKAVFADGLSGVIEDIVTLPGDIEDQVYYVVSPTPPDSGSTVRWLLKWAREDECQGGVLNKQADAFVAYTGAPTTTLSGGSHLNGLNVVVWADGKVLKNPDGTNATFLVAGGSITVPNPVSNAIWGLAYSAQFKSVKLAYASQLGTALGQRKRVPNMSLILSKTHAQGLKFGPDFTNLDDLPSVEAGTAVDQDSIWDQYDEGPVPFPGGYHPDSRICLQSQAPRPCTVLAAIVEVETAEPI